MTLPTLSISGTIYVKRQRNHTPEGLKCCVNESIMKAPTEFNVALHGESYHVKVTGAGLKNQMLRHFYFTVDGVPEDIVVETLDEIILDERRSGCR